MELKDRIQYIMASEKVSPSTFADLIGVQRSSISHILSGRNKPSLEFLQKILLTYPKYNTDWLILGKGEALNNTNTTQNKVLNTASDLFSNVNTLKDEDPVSYGSVPKINTDLQKTPLPIDNNTLKKVSIEKSIIQIIICYSDNTFTAYSPEL